MTTQMRTGGRMLPALARAAVMILAAGALYLAARPAGYAADKEGAGKAVAGPIDFVPADSMWVVSIRVADVWDHPAVKAWRAKAGQELPEPFEDVRREFGVGLDEVERITEFAPAEPGPDGALTALTTLKPYDRKAILSAAAPAAKEETFKDRSVYFNNPNGHSFYFLDDRTFLVGQQNQVHAYLSGPHDGGEGPMAQVLKLAAEKHLFVMGLDAAAARKRLPPPNAIPPGLKPLAPLLKAQFATLTVDLGDSLQAKAMATFADEADAKDASAAADAALDMFRDEFAGGAAFSTKQVDAPKLKALLDDIQAAMKTAKAEQKGATVEASAALPIDSEKTTAALVEMMPKLHEAAKRNLVTNDLKLLALAAQSYHDAMGHLPAPAITDKNGKPLLSWRVAVLPYIEQGNLYNEFHLDEPWDSDHNKKLLEKMPPQYAPPDSQAFKDHQAVFQAFVGKGTVFEEGKPLTLVQITDGTSNTLLFVEAAKPVPWTKPEDIPFDEGKLLPKVAQGKSGFAAVFCDGYARYLPSTLKEETLRALITPNGGEPVFAPDIK